jgi:hypothetical protein
MNQLVFLIENIAPAIYIFGGIIIFFGLIRLIRAGHELSIAEFALERELAMRQRAGTITRMLFSVEVMLAAYAIANVVAPTIRADILGVPVAQSNAPDVAALVTQPPSRVTLVNTLGTPLPRNDINAPFQTLTAMPRGDNNFVVGVTQAAAPTQPGTIIPGVSAPIGCENDPASAVAFIDIPRNGQVLYESITVQGIANAPTFGRYKFEIAGPGTGGSFAPFGGDKTQPVKEMNVLGQLSLLPFSTGEYQFKLAVFDTSDQLRASCTITVYLRKHPPTLSPAPPTPTPSK